MAHAKIPNGGLLHAKGLASPQDAWGHGSFIPHSTNGKATVEQLKEAHAFNTKGDVRCPACKRVDHAVKTSPHTCSHCPTTFKVLFQH